MQLKENARLQSGKYRIIRVLGQGGFGITYLAEHTMLDKLVAIKEFFPKEYCDRDVSTSHLTIGTRNSLEIVEMLKGKFIKEARNISRLHHPNIITIHDIFEENETAYYVMEYVEGSSLSDKVKNNGAMSETEALGYISKIAKAVGYMHSMSMNHLDLKPANIMVRESDGEPILIDFGLSKQYDASGDQTSTTPIGISHGFAPIEQYRPGGVSVFTPQTDIYALGATLFNLLSGQLPPHYSDILEDGLPELPISVSSQTVDAVEHAMEIKKNKRPSSIEEFIKELPNLSLDNALTKELSNKEKIDNTQILSNTLDKVGREDEANKIINSTGKHRNTENKEIIEETVVLLNVPLLPNNVEESNRKSQYNPSEQLQYLDLGLSVKWATKIRGKAYPSKSSDSYQFQLEDGLVLSPDEFLSKGNKLPTIKHFEELLERCSWTTFEENGIHGYKITGPNGNILMMPLGILNYYLSAECLKPNCLYYYLLYLGEYTHSLAKGIPVTANIWTIKE
ncbi:MAG: serine/threonine protein kinase [Muribaculaceae bacterium]|nr:serine/threonine protein kinase [Muribaculaceae bacterium]